MCEKWRARKAWLGEKVSFPCSLLRGPSQKKNMKDWPRQAHPPSCAQGSRNYLDQRIENGPFWCQALATMSRSRTIYIYCVFVSGNRAFCCRIFRTLHESLLDFPHTVLQKRFERHVVLQGPVVPDLVPHGPHKSFNECKHLRSGILLRLRLLEKLFSKEF